ncbi:hypothetical protein A2U01_0005898, partial [Trifolium medium]|nr:hypothetical protein [Trifolium medium]
ADLMNVKAFSTLPHGWMVERGVGCVSASSVRTGSGVVSTL